MLLGRRRDKNSSVFFRVGVKLFSEMLDEEMKIQSSLLYFCEYVRRDEEMHATHPSYSDGVLGSWKRASTEACVDYA